MEIPKDKEELLSAPEKFREYTEVYSRVWAKLDALLTRKIDEVHERIHNGEVMLPKNFKQKPDGETN